LVEKTAPEQAAEAREQQAGCFAKKDLELGRLVLRHGPGDLRLRSEPAQS